jgi:hypothetical protein
VVACGSKGRFGTIGFWENTGGGVVSIGVVFMSGINAAAMAHEQRGQGCSINPMELNI